MYWLKTRIIGQNSLSFSETCQHRDAVLAAFTVGSPLLPLFVIPRSVYPHEDAWSNALFIPCIEVVEGTGKSGRQVTKGKKLL
jgi:hypothetical protein